MSKGNDAWPNGRKRMRGGYGDWPEMWAWEWGCTYGERNHNQPEVTAKEALADWLGTPEGSGANGAEKKAFLSGYRSYFEAEVA
jgi:hypothetical protein